MISAPNVNSFNKTSSNSNRLKENLRELLASNQIAFIILTTLIVFLGITFVILIIVSLIYSISICRLFGSKSPKKLKSKSNSFDKSQLKSLLDVKEATDLTQSDHIGRKLTKFLCASNQPNGSLYCAAQICDKKGDEASTNSDPSRKFVNDKTKVFHNKTL